MTIADSYERAMLALVNEERTSRGLTALKLEQNLNQSAEDHSEWMLQTDNFSHTGAGGSSAGDRMEDADFDFSGRWTWAENLAVQSERGSSGILDDVEDLHESLMNSPGHRANILNPDLEYIGIGIERGDFTFDSGRTFDSVIVTQNFARTQGDVDVDNGRTVAPTPTPTVAEQVVQPVALRQATTNTPTLNGTSGNNTLFGTDGSDVINGLNGNDRIHGRDGDDRIDAGSGNDKVYGGDGNNVIKLGAGNDLVSVSGGQEKLYGGAGIDTISYYASTSGVGVNLWSGKASGDIANGDRFSGFENASGSATAADRLYGNDGSNTLRSFGGNDQLFGRGGNDKLVGGDGRDYLDGDRGNDLLFGGAGADTFHFDNGDNNDRIADFQNNVDTIQLDNFQFRRVSDALDLAYQAGNNVVFEFDNGSTLRVDDVTLNQLANDLVLV